MYSIEDAIVNSQGLAGIKNKLIREGYITLSRAIKNKFGVDMTVIRDMDIKAATEWIRHYDKRFVHHIENPQSLLMKDRNRDCQIINSNFFLHLEENTFLFVSGGFYHHQDGGDAYLYLYFFGKKAYKWLKRISKFIEKFNIPHGNRTYFITAGRQNTGFDNDNEKYWTCVGGFYEARSINSIYMDQDKKNQVISHLDNWIKNRNLYKERGLTFKTGILLYGNAGTGKSSMATAIATYLQCGLVMIDTTTFHDLNISELTEAINADEDLYVVLIDEIDSIFTSRDDENLTEKQNENTTKLLSFLDSPQSPSNVVFIATTNYKDKLDTALLRKGRFDLEIELDDFDKDRAFKMCKGFGLTDSEAHLFLEKTYKENFTINPSDLQTRIIGFLNDKNDEEV